MKTIIFVLIFCFSLPVYSWEGFDWEKGAYIEVEKGELVREGEIVEFFDYDSGEYRSMDIDFIDRIGGSIEITGRDHETGEPRTFDMD